MSRNHTVAVILINWNSFDVTNDCLNSLQQLTHPSYRVIVVDNGSVDGSADRLEPLHPGVIFLRSTTNLGFTGGNNLGLRYSIEKGFVYSILLNNDTLVEPDFLAALTDYMDQHPNTGAIQPRIFYQHNPDLLWNGGSYFNRFIGYTYTKGEGKPPHPVYNTTKQVDWITGCAFMTRNSILQQTGLLATNMFMYSEDVDLSFRIRQSGYQLVYYPASVIYHIAGMSTKSRAKEKEGYVNPAAHYYNQRNRLWILRKYTPWYYVPTVVLFNFFYIAHVMGYFVLRGRFQKLKAVGRAVKDGLFNSIKYDH